MLIDHDNKVIDRVRQEIADGTTFHYKARSHKSVYGYKPMAPSGVYQAILKALGTYADSDMRVDHSFRIMRKVNPYTTANEMLAQVAEVMNEIVKTGWYDTATATGPEPGRPSTHQKETTFHQSLLLELLFLEIELNLRKKGISPGYVPGMGWALEAIIKQEDLFIPHWNFPAVCEHLKERNK